MDTKGFVVRAVCLAVCVAMGGMVMATTIPEGGIEYWSGHYLEGKPLRPGFDIFGTDYQARTSKGFHWNHTMCWKGFPPYEGDDHAYFERLIAFLAARDGIGNGGVGVSDEGPSCP